MNPAEKVKAILDKLTVPLCKDDPFGTGGRKTVFNGSCNDYHTLTYQAFVNRICTFKPENWSSDPNAAIFLAKYGFKTLSGCRVCCCSCGVEVDLGVFLGKRDVLRTLALKSHKQYCRWLHVSTPEAYFTIPRNPHKSLQDLKITVTEMMTFQSNLPIILKDNWVNKMGISEAFMMSLLNFLEHTYSDLLASCVVLSLCGWVKRNEKSLQCNFCQRVVGVWNFISDNVKRSRSRSSNHSRVISLLYSEIRRSMESKDDSGTTDVNCEQMTEPNSVGQTDLNFVGTSESSQGKVVGTNHVCENECSLEELEKISSHSEQNQLSENKHLGAYSSSQSTWDYGCDKQVSSKSHESMNETYSMSDMVLFNNRSYHSFRKSKNRAIKCLVRRDKKARNTMYSQNMEQRREGLSYIDTTDPEVHETVTELGCENKEYSDISSCDVGDNEKKQSIANIELKSNNYSASSDENGFYCTEPNVREETQSVKTIGNSLGQSTMIIDSSDKISEKMATDSGGKVEEEDDSDLDSYPYETNCSDDMLTHEMRIPCRACKILRIRHRKKEKHLQQDDQELPRCTLEGRLQERRERLGPEELNQSENSCDIPESGGHSDGRRKRKRVPESERNGSPYDSGLLPHLPAQMEPVHFTRSKKKELEKMLSKRAKSAKVPSNKDNGAEVIEILSSEGEPASECDSVTTSTRAEYGDSENYNNVSSNSENDLKASTQPECGDSGNYNEIITSNSENESKIVSNHEDNAFLAPVISLVVGNAVQDYFEKGCKTRSHMNDELSESETLVVNSPEKSLHNSTTGMSYDAPDDTLSEADGESPKSKRMKQDTSEDGGNVSNMPDLEDLINDLPPSYFHPELEHRYWCIWRIQVAECLTKSCEWKRGWELYMAAVQKGLELQKAEKLTVCEVEDHALGYLADIVTLTKQRNK